MSSPSRFARAEIVMDCIAVADIALLVLLTIVLIERSPQLPFGAVDGCEPPTTHCSTKDHSDEQE